MKINGIKIGNSGKETKNSIKKSAKKKYRILIQERLSKGSKIEVMTSFMIYDLGGRTTINSIKKKLQLELKVKQMTEIICFKCRKGTGIFASLKYLRGQEKDVICRDCWEEL